MHSCVYSGRCALLANSSASSSAALADGLRTQAMLRTSATSEAVAPPLQGHRILMQGHGRVRQPRSGVTRQQFEKGVMVPVGLLEPSGNTRFHLGVLPQHFNANHPPPPRECGLKSQIEMKKMECVHMESVSPSGRIPD